jgi:hypothetical protein
MCCVAYGDDVPSGMDEAHSGPRTAHRHGRHSLPVFGVGSLLSMTGAIIRYEMGALVIDTPIIAGGSWLR